MFRFERDVDLRPTYISVCTGIGGLDLAFEVVFPNARPVLYMENEIAAAQRLVALVEAGCLRPAPVWSDLATFDGESLSGLVDAIIAGLPCQPYSIAGKRGGHDDRRAIWPAFIRLVEQVRPALVFLENVPEFIRHFAPVQRELEALGYVVAAPAFFTAEEVGASHRRERVFVLAYRDGLRHKRWRGFRELGAPQGEESSDIQQREWDGYAADDRGEGMAHASQSGLPLTEPETVSGDGRSDTVAVTGLRQLPQPRRGPKRRDGSGSAIPLFPPGPADREAWGRILSERPDLAPALEHEIHALADGFPGGRLDWLRCAGNSVVPLQAARALIELISTFDTVPIYEQIERKP